MTLRQTIDVGSFQLASAAFTRFPSRAPGDAVTPTSLATTWVATSPASELRCWDPWHAAFFELMSGKSEEGSYQLSPPIVYIVSAMANSGSGVASCTVLFCGLWEPWTFLRRRTILVSTVQSQWHQASSANRKTTMCGSENIQWGRGQLKPKSFPNGRNLAWPKFRKV